MSGNGLPEQRVRPWRGGWRAAGAAAVLLTLTGAAAPALSQVAPAGGPGSAVQHVRAQPTGAATAPAATQPALADVEQRIRAAFAGHRTVSAALEVDAELPTAAGTIRHQARGTYEFRRAGTAAQFRVETTTTMLLQSRDGQSAVRRKDVLVGDGAHVVSYSEQQDRRAAARAPQRADNVYALSTGFLDGLKADHELTLLPAAEVDARPVYMVQARRRSAAASSAEGQTYAFDQQTGVLLAIVQRGADGKPRHSVRFRDVRVDAEIPAERFVFAPPADVVVEEVADAPGPVATQPARP